MTIDIDAFAREQFDRYLSRTFKVPASVKRPLVEVFLETYRGNLSVTDMTLMSSNVCPITGVDFSARLENGKKPIPITVKRPAETLVEDIQTHTGWELAR